MVVVFIIKELSKSHLKYEIFKLAVILLSHK
jgi:hypothetical protein